MKSPLIPKHPNKLLRHAPIRIYFDDTDKGDKRISCISSLGPNAILAVVDTKILIS